MLDALDGLAQLHTHSIAHGAIKPANLLVREASVAVAGTALAARVHSAELHGGRASARFVSPELLAGDAPPEPTSDIWSMAATFYFLLTLELPRDEYAGQTQLEAAAHNPIVPIRERSTEVPAALARCIDRALSPDRPASAAAFREQLLALEATPPFDRYEYDM
jgi:serine/threonine protein kinase